MAWEPKSLGRVAFDAWMAGEVVQENGRGGYRTIRPRGVDADRHWAALHSFHREVWERIGAAVRDHLEAPDPPSGETILIEVD